MDIITAANCRLVKKFPNAAELFQRAHMKINTLAKPKRDFRTSFGARMRGDISDYFFKRLYFFGMWEPELTNYMKQVIRPGTTVVDVGANHGYFSLLLAQLVGNGRVISIEAAPSVFDNLVANVSINKADNIECRNIAVSDSKGVVKLYNPNPRHSGIQSILPSEGPSIEVPSDRLSSMLASEMQNISFIKIDIEGAERPALLDVLSNKERFGRPLTVVCELSEPNIDLIRDFSQAGFECYYIENKYSIHDYMLSASSNQPSNIIPLTGQKPPTADVVFIL